MKLFSATAFLSVFYGYVDNFCKHCRFIIETRVRKILRILKKSHATGLKISIFACMVYL